MFVIKNITAISSVVVINFLLFGVTSKFSMAQTPSGLDLKQPIDVEMPQNKQDFVNQCASNLEANNTDSAEANSYCSCSADAVYKYLSQDNNVSSDGDVIEAILQCRVTHITNEE